MINLRGLLLGSTASVFAIATAQSADLPTRKSAPADYVKLCNVGGMAGFVLPGSSACAQLSGYTNAQFQFGTLSKGYGPTNTPVYTHAAGGAPVLAPVNPMSQRPSIGFSARAMIQLDVRTDTPFGVLRGYTDLQFDNGGGLNSIGGGVNGAGTNNNNGYIDHAYLQWAGLTAGKADSFFQFYGGGNGWANIFSPNQNGSNEPALFAYTATFGGGFSATIAAQSPLGDSAQTNNMPLNYTYNALKAPDIVGVLRLDQSWGSAQLSAVAHNVNVTEAFDSAGSTLDKWGWGLNGGVKFNLPTVGTGDFIEAQATYAKSAIWYSGLPDGEWGENGQVNGNGIAMPMADTFFYRNAAGAGVWATPTAWSASMVMQHYFSPQFIIGPEFSYGQLHWSGGGAGGNIAPNADSWIAGLVGFWVPVPHLTFELELLYQDTHQSTPALYSAAANGGQAFPSNTSGLEGRFQVTRDF